MPYMYAADLWCDRCGEDICNRLDKEGLSPEDPEDHSMFDSDDYPKYIGDDCGECDTPPHCGSGEDCWAAEEFYRKLRDGSEIRQKVSCMLDFTPTEECVEYVKEALTEEPCSPVVIMWAEALSEMGYDVERTMVVRATFDITVETGVDLDDAIERIIKWGEGAWEPVNTDSWEEMPTDGNV